MTSGKNRGPRGNSACELQERHDGAGEGDATCNMSAGLLILRLEGWKLTDEDAQVCSHQMQS